MWARSIFLVGVGLKVNLQERAYFFEGDGKICFGGVSGLMMGGWISESGIPTILEWISLRAGTCTYFLSVSL